MKKVKTILALALVLVMVLALSACGSKKEEIKDDLTIGFSSHGAGVWIIDICRTHAQHHIENQGFTFESVAANFSSDQMVNDVQNACMSGQDGHMYTNTWGTILQSCAEIFEKNETLWVNYDQIIGEDMIDYARENPYYVGTIGADAYVAGYIVGEVAASLGYKSAVLIGGAIGDTVVDARLNGFTEAFAAGGGEVLAQARCTDPSEAAAKGDDLIAAYGDQIDCFFGQNADFTLPVISALENYGYEAYPFTAEPDAMCLEMIKNGEMSANTPTGPIASVLSASMLINAIDGHAIVDENGDAPWLNSIKVWLVTPDNADVYQATTIDGNVIADDDFNNLLYRYNEDITYDEFCDFVEYCGTFEYNSARTDI